MANIDENAQKFFEEAGCDINRDFLLGKGDVEGFDACKIDKLYPEDPDYTDIIKYLDDLVDETDEESKNKIKDVEDCIQKLTEETDKVATKVEQVIEFEPILFKLKELRDNMYPLYWYHYKRVQLLNVIGDKTESQIESLGATTNQNLLNATINRLERIPDIVSGYTSAVQIEPRANREQISANIFSATVGLKRLIEDILQSQLVEDISFITDEYEEDEDLVMPLEYVRLETVIEQIDEDEEMSGSLYVNYYNLLDDPLNNFFTLQERGLTANISFADNNLKKRAANANQKIQNNDITEDLITVKQGEDTYYIKNNDKYINFFKTFPERLEKRLAEVKDNKAVVGEEVEPIGADQAGTGMLQVKASMDRLAIAECNYYARLYHIESSSTYTEAKRYSAGFLSRWSVLESEISRMEGIKSNLANSVTSGEIIDSFKANVPCVRDNAAEEPDPLPEQKIDLVNSLVEMDPENPNPTKYCYWVQFAKLATLYGLLPFPDKTTPGSLRYWPVGFLLPTPAGIVKIPLPIIWIPVVTISFPFGIIVVFIGLCGIVPVPYVFFINNQGVKKFFLTLRGPSDEFGCNSEDKTIKDYLTTPLNSFGNIDFDSGMSFNPAVAGDEESLSDFLNIVKKRIHDKFDNINDPEMPRLNNMKESLYNGIKNTSTSVKELNNKLEGLTFNTQDFLDNVKDDLKEYMDGITFPSFKFPTDGATLEQQNIVADLGDMSKDLLSNKFKVSGGISLKPEIINKIDEVSLDIGVENNDKLTGLPDMVNLKNAEHFSKVKDYFGELGTAIIEKIRNNTDLLTSLSMVPPGQATFSWNCQDEYKANLPNVAKTAALAAAALALGNMLNALSNSTLIGILGFSQFNLRNIPSIYATLLRNMLPDLPLPSAEFSLDLGSAMTNMITNFLTMISIKIPIPGITLAGPITVDMNVAKEGIKSAIDFMFEQTPDIFFNMISLQLNSNIKLLSISVTEFKQALLEIIDRSFDQIGATFEPAWNTFHALSKLRNIEVNFLDLIMIPTKIVQMAISALADSGLHNKFNFINPDMYNIAFELLRQIERLPFIIPAAVCAFADGDIIRNLHPILYCDDLPPWERLSLDNFLFVVFLDQFCHNGKIKGGFMEKFL